MAKKEVKFDTRYIRISYDDLKTMVALIENARNEDYDEHSSIRDDAEDYITLYPDGTVRATVYFKAWTDSEDSICIETE